jgi:hypothetical protein
MALQKQSNSRQVPSVEEIVLISALTAIQAQVE